MSRRRRFRRPFLIHDSDITSGSVVLNLDGRVLGMVVQRDDSERSRRVRSQGQGAAAENRAVKPGEKPSATQPSGSSQRRDRSRSPFSVVFGGHYLKQRATDLKQRRSPESMRPKLRTVGILPARNRRRVPRCS